MPKLMIDNKEVEVPAGWTVLQAARKLGIEIPTMCFLEGLPHATSCMACLVKLSGTDKFQPSCALPAAEGMRIDSQTPEVLEARRTALELLLGDHLGDCDAPCQSVCPGHMNIPVMIRRIAAGDFYGALVEAREALVLPGVLGRICPAPCEKGCRRGQKDAAISIRALHRFAADAVMQGRDASATEPMGETPMPRAGETPATPMGETPMERMAGTAMPLPIRKRDTGKKVAIVGAGPAGLAVAYHLLVRGHACTVFDEHERAGGMLRYAVEEARLDRRILDAEIATIEALGADFRFSIRVGREVPMEQLRRDFDAVAVAVGQIKSDADRLGLRGAKVIEIDHKTHQASEAGVFCGGSATAHHSMAVRAVADGKAIAIAIDQYLGGVPVTGPEASFSVHIGRLDEKEMGKFMAPVSPAARAEAGAQGLTCEQAGGEAARCLHCDCRKPHECKLRRYSHQYGARAARFKGPRRTFEQDATHKAVIYESGKCIDCGICVQLAERHKQKLGLTFVGRGFSVRVAVPLGGDLAAALDDLAVQCAAACPTGAIVLAGA